MELLVFPFLVLAGLLFPFAGGSDSGEDDDGTDGQGGPGQDSLDGVGQETIRGGEGDDELTLVDQATGLGGPGDDTLRAFEGTTAYGMTGDDFLQGSGTATLVGADGDDHLRLDGHSAGFGGAGSDLIEAQGESRASGGTGADRLLATDDASVDGGWGDDVLGLTGAARGSGGEGDDRIIAAQNSTADGGAGDDLFLIGSLDSLGEVTLTGGAGQDRFIVTDLRPDTLSGDTDLWDSTSVTVHDFDPAQDRLGIVADPAWIGEFRLYSTYDAQTDTTRIILQDPAPYSDTAATFTLRGQHQIDLGQIAFYAEDLTPLELDFWGTAGDDSFSSGGHPAGGSVVRGREGDDILSLTHGELHGGEGDDSLSGNATIFGEQGNDQITGEGIIDGGRGDDQITLNAAHFGNERDVFQGAAHGGEGSDTINAWNTVPETGGGATIGGGAGDDVIRSSHSGTTDAGGGDDTLVMGLVGRSTDLSAITLGEGSDRLVISDLVERMAELTGGGNAHAIVTDFDLAHDEIGLILPQAERGNVAVSLAVDPDTGDLVLRMQGDGDLSVRLAGVSSGYDLASVQLYADEAAARAGTPYATL